MSGTYDRVQAHQLPFLVLQTTSSASEDPVVLGYAYVSPYKSDRCAYAATVELTIFLSRHAARRGFGTLLLRALLQSLRSNATGRHVRAREVVANASVFEDDPGGFYLREGFRLVGTFERMGWKLGRWVDVSFYQLSLEDGERREAMKEEVQ